MTTLKDVRDAALAWRDAGASPLPIKADGSKSPDVDTWKPLMLEAEDRETITAYYKVKGHTGLGIVFGFNGFECLDFDAADIWDEYQKVAAEAGLDGLLRRVAAGYCERTPNGMHLIYRCSVVSGNKKLAADPARGRKSGLIETRGQGGYAIVAPSNGKVHESGKPYVIESGGPSSVVEITPEEREELLALARSLDRRPPPAPRERPTRLADGARPGDAYNVDGPSWADLLEPAGWAQVYTQDAVTYWCRPGKSAGVSATTNHAGSDLLWVFSTNADPFEADRSYDKFGAYAALEHGGNLKAAAKALAAEGYGEDEEPQRFTLVSARELAEPVEPMRWLVHRVWPEQSHGPLAGAKKSLKSWNALALAVAVASGRSYLGEFAVNTRGPVLLFNGEGGRLPFQRRYQRICAAYDVDPATLPLAVTFDVGSLEGKAFRDAVRAHLDAVQPVLVVLDPLYVYHPAGIEAQNLYERGRMLGELSALVGYDTALLVVDHYRKTGGTNLDLDEIGQSGVAQWADSWILQAHREEPDLDTGRFQLAVEHGSRQWGGHRWAIDWDTGEFDYEECEPSGAVAWKVERADGRQRRSGKARLLTHEELLTAVAQWVTAHPPTSRKRVVTAVMAENRAGRDRVEAAFDALVDRQSLVSREGKVPQERGGKTVEVTGTVWEPGDLRVKRTGDVDRPGGAEV